MYDRRQTEIKEKTAPAYRGRLHQVVVIIPIICEDVFREPRRMACAIIWLRSSQQKSEICYKTRNKQDWKFCLSQTWAYNQLRRVVPIRVILLPSGHLATSGDILGCHGWMGPKMLLKIFQCTRQILTTNNYLVQSVNHARDERFRLGARNNAKISFLPAHKKILFRENTV